MVIFDVTRELIRKLLEEFEKELALPLEAWNDSTTRLVDDLVDAITTYIGEYELSDFPLARENAQFESECADLLQDMDNPDADPVMLLRSFAYLRMDLIARLRKKICGHKAQSSALRFKEDKMTRTLQQAIAEATTRWVETITSYAVVSALDKGPGLELTKETLYLEGGGGNPALIFENVMGIDPTLARLLYDKGVDPPVFLFMKKVDFGLLDLTGEQIRQLVATRNAHWAKQHFIRIHSPENSIRNTQCVRRRVSVQTLTPRTHLISAIMQPYYGLTRIFDYRYGQLRKCSENECC